MDVTDPASSYNFTFLYSQRSSTRGGMHGRVSC